MEFPSFTKIHHREPYPSVSPHRPDLSAQGKVVLITGGGSGIGQSTAIAFAKAKADVIIVCGRRIERLEETKTKIDALHLETRVFVQPLDVTSQTSVDVAFVTIHDKVGPIDIDIVINAAGHLSEPGSLKDTSVSNFWDTFEVNLKGAFLVTRAFLNHCHHDRDRDRVEDANTNTNTNNKKPRVLIFLSSLLAHLPANQVATAPASYGISKLSQVKLAEYIAAENDPTNSNLRVYALQPGIIATEMSDRSLAMAPAGTTRESIPWDHPDLPGHFMVWLASSRGAAVPSGRFLWVNWDVDELEARSEELKADPGLLTMGLGGWYKGVVR